MVQGATSTSVRNAAAAVWLIVSIVSAGIARQAPANGPPLRIESVKGNVRMNSVLVTIHCTAGKPFTDGSIVCRAGKYGSKKVDTLSLWSGNFDSSNFDKTLHYMMQVAKGSKGRVHFTFSGSVGGSQVMDKHDLYAYRLADTLLLDEGSYGALDKAEVDYLIRKKGYTGKSDEEIKALDPELWKKMEKVKGMDAPKKM